jgi:hypothetical protein
LQFSPVPALQSPAWQFSVPLHTLPSLHDVPLSTGVLTQPVPGLQLSVVHGLLSLHSGGLPLIQVPAWQVSSPLQTVPSAHDEPLGSAVFWHPVAGLQVSIVHALPSMQASGAPAVQMAVWQRSSPLQALPSLHDEPFGSGAVVQPKTRSQLSVVQGFASLHVSGVPAAQAPA